MLKKVLGIILLINIGLSAQARNAEYLIHNRGMLWETMKDNGTIGAPNPTNRFEYYPSMDWPGGPDYMDKDDQRSYMLGAGIWMGGKVNGEIFYTENGPFIYVDQGSFEEIEQIDNFVESGSFDPNEAEQTIIAKWTTTEGIHVKRTSRVWSYPGYNNFILMEYEITNNNSYVITDFYTGFPYLIRPSYQDFVVHNGWGDDFNRADEIVQYDETLKLLYAYDDTPNYSLPSDVGNYWDDQNELRTTGYAGYSIVSAPIGSNGESQPSNVMWAQLLNNERFFTISSSNKESLYSILSGSDKSLQAGADERLSPFMLMSCGPYNIQPNETIKIVVVEAVDGLPIEDAVKGLNQQENLPKGETMLKETIARAIDVADNNYVVENFPPPPPEIEVIAVPEDKSISIVWSPIEDSWINPVTGKSDIKEYKIYRSETSFIGPWVLIRNIQPRKVSHKNLFFDELENEWVYQDNSISLGAGYFYAVTSMDSSDVEGGLTNRNVDPIFATRNPAEDVLNVKVFPNPFKMVSGFPVSGSENSIVWTNLPAQCTVRIYTSSGELVKTMEHDSEFSGEETWNQLSDARQRIAPGIYFWTVESSKGNTKGTLLIIK